MNSNRKEIEANLSPDHFNDHLMAWMYANGTVFDGEEVESVTYNIDDLNKKGDGTFPVVIKLKQKEGARAVERDEEITI